MASGVSAGLTLEQLRHADFHRPFRGLRSLIPPPTDLYARSLAAAPLLREEDRFSHLSALALYGCPIRVPHGEPVHVESRYGSGSRRTAGITGHRWRQSMVHEVRVCRLDGLVVHITSPVRALAQCVPLLPFSELVVAVDHLLRSESRRLTDSDLSRLRIGTAAGARLARAVSIARVGAESRMETLTRLAGVRAGAPELALQFAVCDARGETIGRFDLAHETSRSLFEYDGEQHRVSRVQYLRDVQRLDRARDAGWSVTRFHAEEVLRAPAEVGARILSRTGSAAIPVDLALCRLLDEVTPASWVSAHPEFALALV